MSRILKYKIELTQTIMVSAKRVTNELRREGDFNFRMNLLLVVTNFHSNEPFRDASDSVVMYASLNYELDCVSNTIFTLHFHLY